jgi:(E)-4-hydroxy-3-methylbut-2-enyl-diphosphate synthase
MVGDVGIGGDHPIRVQSMTTPATTDTDATVDQIVGLVEAGCEIVRLTVPTSRDAENLPNIRRGMRDRGVRVPLVADIHFTPAAAMKAVEHVEKIRINPGNYADKKKFAVREYTDAEYAAELERIETVFSPLVQRCRELGVAMRIGTNHGSLSDRIMNRYGDTPEGMVRSALEFADVCELHGFRDIVFSMKASNPVVVLEAYRLLVLRMEEQGRDYPLHLGVTEAGDGEDARIKSAVGIGVLLEEGIGDTVRVSLTEDPVAEIPVCRALVAPYNAVPTGALIGPAEVGTAFAPASTRERRPSRQVRLGPRRLGDGHPVLVEAHLTRPATDESGLRAEIDAQVGPRVPEETRAEVISVDAGSAAEIAALHRLRTSLEAVAPDLALSASATADFVASADEETLEALARSAHRLHTVLTSGDCPIDSLMEVCGTVGTALLLEVAPGNGDPVTAADLACDAARAARDRRFDGLALAVFPGVGPSPLHAGRLLAASLDRDGLDVPIVLVDRPAEREAEPLLGPSTVLGGLLCDGIGDALQIRAVTADESRRTAFNLLQAARVRITKTEFISCPSCGRTLFDLESTTARIKARTSHLKGVKIAIMGCVVNGPGEMADADFGYVGWGEGKIALFVGRDMVEKDIPAAEADDRLVELIRQNGRWVDPPVQ